MKASRYEAQGILLNKCFPPYFIRTAHTEVLSGGYLLLHYISISLYRLMHKTSCHELRCRSRSL